MLYAICRHPNTRFFRVCRIVECKRSRWPLSLLYWCFDWLMLNDRGQNVHHPWSRVAKWNWGVVHMPQVKYQTECHHCTMAAKVYQNAVCHMTKAKMASIAIVGPTKNDTSHMPKWPSWLTPGSKISAVAVCEGCLILPECLSLILVASIFPKRCSVVILRYRDVLILEFFKTLKQLPKIKGAIWKLK